MADTRLGPDSGSGSAKDTADRPEHAGPEQAGQKIGEGPGRLLVSLYALFTVAAGGRSVYQLIAQFHHAPLSYILSALAAAIYAVILVTLVRGGPSARRVALVCCAVELVGVLTVGTLTLVIPSAFPDQTVWSYYGMGYVFIPLALPVSGILWLRKAARQATVGQAAAATAGQAS